MDTLRTVLLCVAAAAVAAQLARTTTAGSRLMASAFIAALAGAALLRRPSVGFAVLVITTSTLWYTPRVPLALGPVRTDEGELLAFALIALGMLWVLLGGAELEPPYRGGLVLLVAAVAVGAGFALVKGTDSARVVSGIKGFSLYLLVLPVCLLYRTARQQQALVRLVMTVAVVGSAAVLASVASGRSLEGRPGVSVDPSDLAAVTRVRPALLPLLFLATMIVVGRISSRGARPADVAVLGLFLCVWGVSYNRSSWVALALAGSVLVCIRPGRRILARTLVAVLAVVGSAALLFTLALRGVAGPVPQTVAVRASTIFNDQAIQSNSFDDRELEYRDAGRALSAQPVLGVGVGSSYGARRAYYDPALQVIRYQDRLFSHNSVLYLYLQLGLLGLVAFAALLGEAARRLHARLRQPDEGAVVAAAAGCTLLGAVLESLLNPNLLLRPSIVVFCLCLALVVSPRSAE